MTRTEAGSAVGASCLVGWLQGDRVHSESLMVCGFDYGVDLRVGAFQRRHSMLWEGLVEVEVEVEVEVQPTKTTR